MSALAALDAIGARVAGVSEAISTLPAEGKVPDVRYASYVPRLVEALRKHLK